MEDLVKKDESVRDIILDKSIKIDKNGQVYDTFEFDQMMSNMYRSFSSTLPGSLFGQTDHRLSKELPFITMMKAGTNSITSAYELGNETQILRSSKLAITDLGSNTADLFNMRMDENFNLVLDLDALVEGGILKNIQHGKNSRLIKNMLGTNREAFNRNQNYLAKVLDIDQSGSPNIFEKIKARFTKGDNPD